MSALESAEAHFATIAETKLESDPPAVNGYSWLKKNRKNRQGGGVAIAIRNDILPQVRMIDKVEPDEDTEIMWVAVNTKENNKTKHTKNLAIGVFYGPQENECRDKVENIYSVVTTHINILKQDHNIVLTGDFNAKLPITAKNVKQEISPNGKILQQMLEMTNTTPSSTTLTDPKWTRINRKNTQERAVLDYVITERDENLSEIMIDTDGIYRLKNNNGTETDHETILITTNVGNQTDNKETHKTWKIKDEQDKWKVYNSTIKHETKNNENTSYENLEKIIKKGLTKAFGRKNIKREKGPKKEPKIIKEARRNKREARKQFETAIKTKENVSESLENYKNKQKQLRKEIETWHRENTEIIYRRILEEGGSKSQYFWKIRRQIVGTKEIQYDHVTEDGRKITDPEESKECIAAYYEDLYQARPADIDEKENTENIEKCVEQWAVTQATEGQLCEITPHEVNKAIKRLKNGKSMGPDEIPNEAIIKMDRENREQLRKVFNKILQEQNPPEPWETGTITRLYKGKGQRGKCSNERGITVASNMGKLFERIVNERAKKEVTISDAQAGGKEKRATTDHLLILKEVVASQKDSRKSIFLAYLDVTKAYDKAWLTGIMYALHENGLKGPLWNMIRKLNSNLKAKIKTKDGLTRPILIKDSIRQGGVLSVLMYALLMDEIAKELEKEQKGCIIKGTERKVGCLLWMDDVVLCSETEQEMQEMLNITHKIAKKYHIVFGKEKSKMMTTKKNCTTKFHLGNMEMEQTETYKYLGEIISNNQKMGEHIKQVKCKAEGALQTILGIAKDPQLRGIEMETIWKLLDVCIIPIITYASETWYTTKSEMKDLNRILDSIIKRTLLLPTTTPREALYIETGMKDIKYFAERNRINMEERLEKTQNCLIEDVLKSSAKKSWKKLTEKVKIDNGVENLSVRKFKEMTMETKFKERIEEQAAGKSKVKFLIEGLREWTPGKRQIYLSKLTRTEASDIFKLRSRMIRVKRNYKSAYPNLTCRGCNANEENQQHVLVECTGIHESEESKIYKDQYFTDNVDVLKETCKKIRIILNRLDQSEADP